jgi:hypothetical protein
MSSAYRKKTILLVLLLLAVTLLAVSPSRGAVITENFDNNLFNDDLFWIFSMGSGVTATVANERLEIGIPAAVGGFGNIGIVDYLFLGDFDLQVDFSLLNWPAHNQTQVQMGVGSKGGQGYFQVGRRSRGLNEGDGTEIYYTMVKQQWTGDIAAASGDAGKLRIKRTGATVEGLFWDGSAWHSLGSYSAPIYGQPSYVFMNFSNTGGDSPAILGAFDNIKITYNTLRSGYFPPAPLVPLLME